MVRHLHFNALIVGSTALAWAIACGSSNDTAINSRPSTNDCRVGSEGCPCTTGKGCDKGLVCFDPLCFKPDAAGPVGTGGAQGTGGQPQGGINGVAGAGSGISGIVTGGASSGSGGGGAPNGGSSGVPNGGTGGSVNPDGGGLGPPASCPFPTSGTRNATRNATAGPSKDKFDAKFQSGRLVELDSKPCTTDTSGVVPTGDWGTYSCRDAYSCGGCLVFVISQTDQNALGTWFIVGANEATGGTTPGCPEYSVSYDICAPDCAGKQCGDDGCGSFCGSGCGTGNCCNAQNACVVDSCSNCLDACFDACGSTPGCSSSCCTGSGCACAGACPGPC